MKTTKYRVLAASVSMLVLPSIGSAEDTELLDTLLLNGLITKGQYEELASPDASSTAPPAAAAQTADTIVVTPRGGLRGVSSDGLFSYELGGRVVAYAAAYDIDQTEMGSGTKLRRVRFDVEGQAWFDWSYSIELDLAEDEVEVKDTYIEYTGFNNVEFRLGHTKEPFSLDEQTSSLFNTFMERALPNAFAPPRNVGLLARSSGKNWTVFAGVYGEGLDDLNGDEEIDEGIGASTRMTFTPIERERANFHIGLSASYRKTGDDKRLRIRARPESNNTSVRFVNTGRIADVEDHQTFGIESAMMVGRFSLQGEYITKTVNLADNVTSYDFDGYYALASFFLTGESREFVNRTGEFGRIRPRSIVGNGGTGAWEVALRASSIDLDDGDVEGGVEDNFSFALNWYPTPNIRFMFNYIKVESLRRGVADDPNIYQLGAQFDF